MEAVGRLTAGIAHDFNNLLTVVIGNIEMAERRSAAGDPVVARLLQNAMGGARQAAMLTERLLSFARRKALEPRLLDVNDAIDRMCDLLRRTLGERIAIETALTPDLPAVKVDPTGFDAALLNLALNARDAMPEGGRLRIGTSFATMPTESAAESAVLIEIVDSGCGMSADVVQRVFEPFFTTKPDGSGTGLGLSQVYGFVRQTGGQISIRSCPGDGTAVRIHLPVASTQAVISADADLRPGAGMRGGTESILVVEDNKDVRDFTVGCLRELGYRVHDCVDAAGALAILEGTAETCLLFTDLGLPGGMDGRSLADHARALRPDLPVLITTAYAPNAVLDRTAPGHGVGLLAKPFSCETLAARIREMLDQGPSRDAAPGGQAPEPGCA
jgi:CheY-like chemotaxis protein